MKDQQTMEERIEQVLSVCKDREGAKVTVICFPENPGTASIGVEYLVKGKKKSYGPVDISGSVEELYKFWHRIEKDPLEGWKCEPLLSGEEVNEAFSDSMDVPGIKDLFGKPEKVEKVLMKVGNTAPQLIFTREE